MSETSASSKVHYQSYTNLNEGISLDTQHKPNPHTQDSASFNPAKTICLSNLPRTFSEKAVIMLAQEFGHVHNTQYLWHTDGDQKGQPRGMAFVEYKSIEAAELALSRLKTKVLDGREVRAEWYQVKHTESHPRGQNVTKIRKQGNERNLVNSNSIHDDDDEIPLFGLTSLEQYRAQQYGEIIPVKVSQEHLKVTEKEKYHEKTDSRKRSYDHHERNKRDYNRNRDYDKDRDSHREYDRNRDSERNRPNNRDYNNHRDTKEQSRYHDRNSTRPTYRPHNVNNTNQDDRARQEQPYKPVDREQRGSQNNSQQTSYDSNRNDRYIPRDRESR